MLPDGVAPPAAAVYRDVERVIAAALSTTTRLRMRYYAARTVEIQRPDDFRFLIGDTIPDSAYGC